MEHKDGIGNEFFNHGDDFDNLIEEKLKGWTKDQSLSQILDNQRPTPQIKDSKIEAVVNAEVESTKNTESSETPETTEASQSTDAVSADEAVDKPETDEPEEIHEIQSDPTYSQSVIEGKTEKPVIRGIQTGPWAKPYLANQTVNQADALDNIGHHTLADFWRRITQAAQHCNGDVEKLIAHIEKLQQAAFYREWAEKAYREELRRVIETGSEAERKKAEIAYARMYKEGRDRVLPDGKKQKSISTPRAPKVEKLLVGQQKGIDTLISLGMTYESIVERYKATGKLNAPILDYIKSKFGKA